MSDKYIIVRVRDTESEMPPNVVVERGKVVLPKSPLVHVRGAIHKVAEEQFLGVADMVTHTRFMREQDSEAVRKIFEDSMRRMKEGHERGYW
jgi:hypothetical protein